MNYFYEESLIKKNNLPKELQDEKKLNELEIFLQANWEQRMAFYNDEDISSKQQFLKFENHGNLRTRKYIGTIAFGGASVTIFPKMFREDETDFEIDNLNFKHLLTNILCWIEYCNRVDYPFLNFKSDLDDVNSLKDLFIAIYIKYVDAEINRALFYRYEEKTEDLGTIRGRFDIKDYLTRKIPNGNFDKFRCNYSSFEYDNMLNRIIKYTCKLLFNHTNLKNQSIIRHILLRLNDVSDMKCCPSDCDKIRLSKLQMQYSVILSMSKIFLLNQMLSFNEDNTESFCFLFPTDLLFEGFISGFMQSVLSNDAKVRLQASDMKLFDDLLYNDTSYGSASTMRHDILVEKNGKVFILDTKYKMLPKFDPLEQSEFREKIKQSDLYQLYSYATRRSLTDVYLLYPLFRHEEFDKEVILSSRVNINNNEECNINVHVLRIPFIYEENIEDTNKKLKEIILNIFD